MLILGKIPQDSIMTTYMKYLLFAIFSFSLSACGSGEPPVQKIGVELAEYDGAYVVTQADRFLPLKDSKTATTRIVHSRKGRVSYSQMLNATDRSYTLDATTEAVLDSSHFKGVFVKGDYKFKLFTLHPLVERTLVKDGKELFFEKHGAVDYDIPFYLPGKSIELLKKSADEENGYYFEVKAALPSGKYVGWIGSHFWIFEITGLDVEAVENENK